MGPACPFPDYYEFPDAQLSDENGVVCMGGDLSPAMLWSAYAQGIFPWPQAGYPVLWFSPHVRGVLRFEELRIPRRYQRQRSKLGYSITFNRDFKTVIRHCATQPRKGQNGTWITEDIIKAYTEFHRLGFAHSVEVWHRDRLVGGLYGVYITGVFSGESMFHLEDHASKEALLALVNTLQKNGLEWMDTQMVTPLLELFGAKVLDRQEFFQWRNRIEKRDSIQWPDEPVLAGSFLGSKD